MINTVTYFNVRGRCEPILLVLEDASVPYTLREFTLEERRHCKTQGDAGPPRFPYSALPVLSITGPDGETDFVGETCTILRFLDKALRTGGAERSAISEAREDMVLEASMFFLNRVFQLSASEDWLAPPRRTVTLEKIVKPYLRCTEEALRGLRQELIPKSTDRLVGTTAAVFASLTFIPSLYPCLQQEFGDGKEYEWCGILWEGVRCRGEIQRWTTRSGISEKAWTASEFGWADWIATYATKYDGKDAIERDV